MKVFKITSNMYDPKVSKFSTNRDHTVTRGLHNKMIYQPFGRSSIRHNCFQSALAKF